MQYKIPNDQERGDRGKRSVQRNISRITKKNYSVIYTRHFQVLSLSQKMSLKASDSKLWLQLGR